MFSIISFSKIVLYFLLSLYVIYLFSVEIWSVYLPIELSVIMLFSLFIYFYILFKKNYIGIVSILYIFAFTLPFIHTIPYLWIDITTYSDEVWGLSSNNYQFQTEIIKLMLMIGLAGMVGQFLASLLSMNRITHSIELRITSNTLLLPIWLFWLIIGVVLSIISSSSEDIFISKYTSSSRLSEVLNFSSAWMMSYILLLYVVGDALVERKKVIRKIKLVLFSSSFIYITIFLQFLSGDRAVLPYILAVFLMLFLWFKFNSAFDFKLSKIKVYTLIVIIVFVYILIGIIRSKAFDINGFDDLINLIISGFTEKNHLKGTWTAVLLTPLSVAGDKIIENTSYLWGIDYVNLVKSLPPGFVSDIFGYTRPWSNGFGPANEMTFGRGGTHVTVVPFRNFGLIGVFFICGINFYIISRLEKYVLANKSFYKLLLLATIVTILPHWLWYGEKNLVTGMIIYIICLFLYKFSLSLQNFFLKNKKD